MREKVKLTANILFSGIGCQERGFQNSELFDVEVLNTSEINKEAVLSYAAIHCGMTNQMVEEHTDYPPREEMAQYLTDINLGYEPEKDKHFDWFKLAKKKSKDIEKYWLACKLTHNLGDISKIASLPYADFWTISFPCTDVSVSGKMKGLKANSGTRSSLLWENIRLLNVAKESGTLPKYIMFENVKNLVSKKFINDFNDLLDILDELGFNSYWSVINGKDCGVPQSRERVFVISMRKDIDSGKYTFPLPFDTGIRLRDVLEKEVDEKYYLSDDTVKRFLTKLNTENSLMYDPWVRKEENKPREYNDYSPAIKARDYKDPKLVNENALCQVGHISNTNSAANRVYTDNLARTLTSDAGGGGGKTGLYLVDNVGVYGIDKSTNNPIIENANCITSREDRGISNRKSEGTAVLEMPDISYCLDANYHKGTTPEQYVEKKRRQLIFEEPPKIIESGQFRPKDRDYNAHDTEREDQFETRKDGLSNALLTNAIKNCIREDFRIRKLTPKECYRLMGLTFEDCDKAAELGVADTHLYKQAGNGIITNCCELLAEHLYKAQYDDAYVCTDEEMQNFTKPQAE